MSSFDFPTYYLTACTALTSLLVCLWLKFVSKGTKQKRGDVQRPSTYAYGSIRQYPIATYYQKIEEYTYLVYLYIYMFIRDGWKSPRHPLAGENLAHSFRKSPPNKRKDQG